MGQDFPLHVLAHVFFERDVLVVAQLGIGFGDALGVGADVRRVVPFCQGHEDSLEQGGWDLEARLFERRLDHFREEVAVLDDALPGKLTQGGRDGFLKFTAFFNFGLSGLRILSLLA